MTKVTKNLGQVQALFIGYNPPLNIKMLFYNQNNNTIYYYDTLLDEWLPLSSNGSGGGVLGLIKTSASSLLVPASKVNGNTIYLCSHSTGIAIELPDARLVSVGAVVRFSLLGGVNAVLTVTNSVVGQELDNQDIDTPVTIPALSYLTSVFLPAQQYGVYSDGFNWFSAPGAN